MTFEISRDKEGALRVLCELLEKKPGGAVHFIEVLPSPHLDGWNVVEWAGPEGDHEAKRVEKRPDFEKAVALLLDWSEKPSREETLVSLLEDAAVIIRNGEHAEEHARWLARADRQLAARKGGGA